jgi:hypothetical protein
VIAIALSLLVVSVALFAVLPHKSIKNRILLSLLFFILTTGGLMAFILFVGDPPPKDAIPITKEILEKEGNMTEREWNDYVQRQRNSKE